MNGHVPSRDVRQTIVQLLSNMSDSREIRTYLSRFSGIDRSRFAVIKIGGAIIRDRLDETAASLAFLHTVGLTPIVIHGGGPQLDQRLEERGIATQRREGLRVTTSEVLDVAREVFSEQNIALVEAIRGRGVPAHGLTEGVFDARVLDIDGLGFVGEPTNVRVDKLRSIVDSGAIPILTCLGVAPGGQILNMNADSATRMLVHVVQPMKIIFLVETGGLLDAEGEVIDSINLVTDYQHLMSQEWVHSGMRLKLSEIKLLLDDSPPSSSVSITTPAALVRELFTHGGAGTLVRKGEKILELTDKDDLDRDRLTTLLETSFGRRLRSGWWDDLQLDTAFIAESYRGAAIVSRADSFAYLDKFAVAESARGEGIARTVWDEMTRHFPIIFWRSRSDNGVNVFYNGEADGSVRRGHWVIFWKGEEDFDLISQAVKLITDLPESFLERSE